MRCDHGYDPPETCSNIHCCARELLPIIDALKNAIRAHRDLVGVGRRLPADDRLYEVLGE